MQPFYHCLILCVQPTENTHSCTILSDTSPVIYSVGTLLTLLSKIDGAHVCIGNPDVSYLALAHKGKFLDQPGK